MNFLSSFCHDSGWMCERASNTSGRCGKDTIPGKSNFFFFSNCSKSICPVRHGARFTVRRICPIAPKCLLLLTAALQSSATRIS